MQLALRDAIAIALLESHGFTAHDFRQLHPGGRLGAMWKFVRNVMHVGNFTVVGARISSLLLKRIRQDRWCALAPLRTAAHFRSRLSRRTTRVSPWVEIIELNRGGAPELYHAIAQRDYVAIVARTPDPTVANRKGY